MLREVRNVEEDIFRSPRGGDLRTGISKLPKKSDIFGKPPCNFYALWENKSFDEYPVLPSSTPQRDGESRSSITTASSHFSAAAKNAKHKHTSSFQALPTYYLTTPLHSP